MIRLLLRLAVVACAVALPGAAMAQNTATAIKVQAMAMATALMTNDFESFVPYMHPNIIAFAGGREALKTKMDSAYSVSRRFGVSFKRYWIGDPEPVVTYKGQLQTLLPQSTTLKTALAEITLESTLLVISNDGGRHWWFIDTNVYGAEKLRNVLPGLSPALAIPPRTKPRIVPVQRS